jgi:hypothetical protein
MARGKPRPGHLTATVLVYALAANGSQTGEGNNQGTEQQVPAKRQNRGPATQRVMVLKPESQKKENTHEYPPRSFQIVRSAY